MNISIDEGCCPWKGHLRFRQYNSSKPNKFHIKLFQVCDPKIGYILHFKIYTGAESCHRKDATANSLATVTTKTVLTLCLDSDILDKGPHIYCDNWYTSVSLLDELFSRGTLACGTARARKFGPQALQAKTNGLASIIGPYQACAYRAGPILAFKWWQKKDQSKKKKKKLVYILSTIHTAMEGYSGRHERDEDRTPIYKPKAVLDYIKQMGGVDLSDQLMNYYHFLRRSNKWWRKLWVHIFNMALLNAYVLNKTYGIRKQLTHHEYRYLLALTLLLYSKEEREGNKNVARTKFVWGELTDKLFLSSKGHGQSIL